MVDKSKYYVWIGIGLTIALLSTGFITYFSTFNSEKSNDASQWAYFSTYLSLFISISSLLFLGIISYITYKTTSSFNELQTTPLLDFSIKQVDKYNLVDMWYMVNCSNAAARNISIRFYTGSFLSNWVACYTLSGGTEVQLPWLRYASKIEVIYSDAFSNRHFITLFGNLIGDFKIISKKDFEGVLPNRVNQANLLIALDHRSKTRIFNRHPLFTDVNDFLNNFGIPTGLFSMK